MHAGKPAGGSRPFDAVAGIGRHFPRTRLALRGRLLAAAAAGVLATAPALAEEAGATQKVYGRTPAESSPPQWPQETKAAPGAPNILVIMTDDVGFGAASSFGGPIPTPTFDALGAQGARYNRFHTTAICSPTRASLLTGRNPQAVGMGYTTNWPTGYDGYNSVIPKSAGTIAQILKEHGYSTAMFGKGHITPEWEMSAAGPFDRWPTGLGFDYFYGFLGADTSEFEPSLVENTRNVEPPHDPDYHLDKDLADHAIRWIAEQKGAAPDKPFLIYLAPGTAHAPNQAPAEWLAKFRGKFDQGWDALRQATVERQKALGIIPAGTEDSPRPETLPRWDSLSAQQKRIYARYMEAYAASLAFADHEIGRVVQSLKDSGQFDNTLIVYIQGDNGASAEGSFDGKLYEQSALSGAQETIDYVDAHVEDIGTRKAYNLNPGGWGWALNAPFPWAKRYGSHLGGLRTGMVVSWPGHIQAPGTLRSQYLHVSDVTPTLLEVAGVQAPTILDGIPQQPITGISFAYTLAAPQAPSHRTSQVYGMAQNLSIYKDGWVAATVPMATPWERTQPKPVPIDQRRWQLYDLDQDFSEAHDLAAQYPDRLAALKDLFWAEASEAGILPIHAAEGHQRGRPDLNAGRQHLVYWTPVDHIPETAAPPTVGSSFAITAEIDVPETGATGVIAAQGGRFGGYSLFVNKDGKPAFTYNLTPAHLTRIAATSPLRPGRHRLVLRLALDQEAARSGGTATLSLDGAAIATGRVPQTFAQVISHTEGFDIGMDSGTAVDDSYVTGDSRFSGTLRSVTFDIGK
ncbi:arylsulfatase [Flavisphingomonas formosensis]|uniref:arylsulfatase n=1 Tax=Flavisphingomonas formosensis TaxID=861534 RepID=UPI0012F8C62D|nr:arylsulfatase [Sphingomonas formosensis]